MPDVLLVIDPDNSLAPEIANALDGDDVRVVRVANAEQSFEHLDWGWVDLVVGLNNGLTTAYLNHAGRDGGHRMATVTLKGPAGNPTGIGARVTLETTTGKSQVAEVLGGDSYLSQSTPTLYFGLGKNKKVDQVTVVWPTGKRQVIKDGLSVGSTLTVEEAE